MPSPWGQECRSTDHHADGDDAGGLGLSASPIQNLHFPGLGREKLWRGITRQDRSRHKWGHHRTFSALAPGRCNECHPASARLSRATARHQPDFTKARARGTQRRPMPWRRWRRRVPPPSRELVGNDGATAAVSLILISLFRSCRVSHALAGQSHGEWFALLGQIASPMPSIAWPPDFAAGNQRKPRRHFDVQTTASVVNTALVPGLWLRTQTLTRARHGYLSTTRRLPIRTCWPIFMWESGCRFRAAAQPIRRPTAWPDLREATVRTNQFTSTYRDRQ